MLAFLEWTLFSAASMSLCSWDARIKIKRKFRKYYREKRIMIRSLFNTIYPTKKRLLKK